ncbi:unnamed protein product [Durusdinium trenchii]|uniref:Uncharacterized protein n=1 Tax=Durusdinium trenchii TaxID=1381693 RepID=A0ABP0PKP5_9DINO
MWKDRDGRKELKKMFEQNGSFATLEIRIRKKHTNRREITKGGGWYTRHVLEHTHGWSKKMIDKAFAWAEANGKLRINKIHGEPEAFLVLSEGFALTSTDVEETEQCGNIAVEDGDDEAGTLLDSDLPDINESDPAALLSSQLAASSSGGAGSSSGGPSPLDTSQGTVYLRMTFPAVVATASPLSVLPQFVEVLGKKIDKIQAELVSTMSQHLTKMQNMYTKLADLMSEATVNPEKLDKQPGIPMGGVKPKMKAKAKAKGKKLADTA